MKKCSLFTVLIIVVLLFTSCTTTTIPTSSEAKEKMESLGYDIEYYIKYGEEAEQIGVQQITFLLCDKDDEYLQAYFFANEEDTDKYYEKYRSALESNVQVIKKNRFSVYRGTKAAVDDFLS